MNGLIYLTHVLAPRFQGRENSRYTSLHSRRNGEDIIVAIKLKRGRAFMPERRCGILHTERWEQAGGCSSVGGASGWRPRLHSGCPAVGRHATYFPPWSNMLSRTPTTPEPLKFRVFEKGKGEWNQCVNRGSVKHTFPGRLRQDQLCIHHSLHDRCV